MLDGKLIQDKRKILSRNQHIYHILFLLTLMVQNILNAEYF